MLDVHTGEHGIRRSIRRYLFAITRCFGTAQLPKFREDQFQTVTEEVRRQTLVEHVKQATVMGGKLAEFGGTELVALAAEDPVNFDYVENPDRFC